MSNNLLTYTYKPTSNNNANEELHEGGGKFHDSAAEILLGE